MPRVKKSLIITVLLLGSGVIAAAASVSTTLLPPQWPISKPVGPMAVVGTMPQGLSLSPDCTQIAVVEAGVNPPALRIVGANNLVQRATIPLKDAFGKP